MIHMTVSAQMYPFRGMQSSVGKDGSQRLIQVLIKANGVCKKSIFFWFCGWQKEVNGERLRPWLKVGQRVK
jgi:hypothetical protein